MKFREPKPEKQLSALAKLGTCKPRILGLRFPRYKNLKPDSSLSLDFPVSFLVGKNGTNKSSVLHALFGSVRGQTPSKYWFDTAIDPISLEDANGVKNSLVVKFVDSTGKSDEALKYRTYREGFEGYWEAAKRTKTYGFPAGHGRAEPVALNVEHFDFRGELSAFDKCFYFIDRGRLQQGDKRLKRKLKKLSESRRAAGKRGLSKRAMERAYTAQDYIRNRAPALKSRLDTHGVDFSDDEVKWLSYVVGREYSEARFIHHDLYGGHESDTVFLNAKNRSEGYSSAFAGSGEFAAAILRHKLSHASSGSLVLLDEPETSLHPTAQSRLRSFLMECALRKSMQVVAATHSPVFLRGLPAQAIKLFRVSKEGDIELSNSCRPDQAFADLDEGFYSGREILVEDEYARVLVQTVLDSMKIESAEMRARVAPGGVAAMWRDVETYARRGRASTYVLFDGDQLPSPHIVDPATLPAGATKEELDKVIQAQTRSAPLSFASLSDPLKPRREFLAYVYRNVAFMPGQYPEQLVWSDRVATDIIDRYDCDISVEDLQSEPDYKQRYAALALAVPGLNRESIFRQMTADFARDTTSNFSCLEKLIAAISEHGTVGR